MNFQITYHLPKEDVRKHKKNVKKCKQQILIKQETCLFLEQNITLRSNNSLIDQLTYRHRK